MMKTVRITWVKSSISCRQAHRRVIESLGLRRLNQSVEKELTPPVKGMIDKVSYLLKVEEVNQ